MADDAAAWRRRAKRLALPALALVLAVATTARHAPDAFRAADAKTDDLGTLSRLDRELYPARAVDIDVDSLLAAREVIPPTATYAVLPGRRVTVSTPVTWVALPQFTGYWLLPRRQSADPRRADWIFAYGGELDRVEVRYRRVVDLKPGIAFAEVAG